MNFEEITKRYKNEKEAKKNSEFKVELKEE